MHVRRASNWWSTLNRDKILNELNNMRADAFYRQGYADALVSALHNSEEEVKDLFDYFDGYLSALKMYDRFDRYFAKMRGSAMFLNGFRDATQRIKTTPHMNIKHEIRYYEGFCDALKWVIERDQDNSGEAGSLTS